MNEEHDVLVDFTITDGWEQFGRQLLLQLTSTSDHQTPLKLFNRQLLLSRHTYHEPSVSSVLSSHCLPSSTSTINDTMSTWLSTWTGWSDFYIIQPQTEDAVGTPQPFDAEWAKFILSVYSLNVLENLSKSIPLIVQCGTAWRQLFLGSYSTQQWDYQLQCHHCPYIPLSMDNFSGVLDMFSSVSGTDAASVESRFTFRIDGFSDRAWKNMLTHSNVLGPDFDPVDSLMVSICHPTQVPEYFYNSDTLLKFSMSQCPIILSLRNEDESILPGLAVSRVLDRIISGWFDDIRLETTQDSKDTPGGILYSRPYSDGISFVDTASVQQCVNFTFTSHSQRLISSVIEKMEYGSCVPRGSLVHNMCAFLCFQVLHKDVSSGARHMIPALPAFIAALMPEITKKLSYHWMHKIPIPTLLEDDGVNLKWCLLWQKICMLNYCIVRWRSENGNPTLANANEAPTQYQKQGGVLEHMFDRTVQEPKSQQAEMQSETDEKFTDDVFYDADETPQEVYTWPKMLLQEYAGRKHKLSLDTFLLLNDKQFLYVPQTQENGVVTQDQVQEMEQLLNSLGTETHGAQIRAKLQSTTLVSDMQAFKAANPGCVLEDFVRWHSPRDFDSENNSLLARMSDPESLWRVLWRECSRAPAAKQVSVFNAEREGEKALDWCVNLDATDVLKYLAPVMICVCVDQLNECYRDTAIHDDTIHDGQENVITYSLDRIKEIVVATSWAELIPDVLAHHRPPSPVLHSSRLLSPVYPPVTDSFASVVDEEYVQRWKDILDNIHHEVSVAESVVCTAISVWEKLHDVIVQESDYIPARNLSLALLSTLYHADDAINEDYGVGIYILNDCGRNSRLDNAAGGMDVSFRDRCVRSFLHKSGQETLPQPVFREFVIESAPLEAEELPDDILSAYREGSHSATTKMRRRMYVSLKDGEFRVCDVIPKYKM